MAPARKSSPRKRPPARTPEARENELISLTTDLAEKQLREGTASAAVMTHFLKLATVREKTELERMRGQIALDQRKVESMASAEKSEEMFTRALEAMSEYKGNDVETVEDGDY